MQILETIKKNPIVMYVLIAIVIFIVLFIIIKAYNSYVTTQNDEPVLISSPTNAKKANTIAASSIPTTTSGDGYSISMWIYIDDWEYRLGEWKHVLHRGDEDGTKSSGGAGGHCTGNLLRRR